MARQYIGARYVPKFTGEYVETKEYQALEVADDGLGTSYIAKKTVPAGTPLTNTEYWAVYGSSSGAIIDLQGRMSSAEEQIEILEKASLDVINVKNFGAVGDGVTDDTQAFKDAINYADDLINGKTLLSPTIVNVGYAFYIPRGHYIINDTLTFAGSAKLSPAPYDKATAACKIYGDGSGSLLDFSGSPNNADSVIIGGAVSIVKDIKISGSSRDSMIVNGPNFKLSDIIVDYGTRNGFVANSGSFCGIIDHCLAYHVDGVGFNFDGFHTSLHFDQCYADGCLQGGFDIGVETGCVYSSLTNCACDSSGYAYKFGDNCIASLVNCGNERAHYALNVGANCDITVTGHFDYESNNRFLEVGPNSKIILDGVKSYQVNQINNVSFIHASGNGTSVLMRNCDVSGDRVIFNGWGAGFTNEEVYGFQTELDINGQAIIGKLKPLFGAAGFTGVLAIQAWSRANTEGNCAIYLATVGGISHVNSLDIASEAGITSAGVSFPAYDFTIDSTERLIATHRSGASASGQTINLSIHCIGNVKVSAS